MGSLREKETSLCFLVLLALVASINPSVKLIPAIRKDKLPPVRAWSVISFTSFDRECFCLFTRRVSEMDVFSIIVLISGWIDKHLSFFLGGYDGPLCTLMILTALNYITTVLCIISDRRNFVEIGLRTVFSKVLIFVIVGVSNILDLYILGYGRPLRTVILLFYISEEGVSILENASHLGLPVPKGIKRILEQLKWDQ